MIDGSTAGRASATERHSASSLVDDVGRAGRASATEGNSAKTLVDDGRRTGVYQRPAPSNVSVPGPTTNV